MNTNYRKDHEWLKLHAKMTKYRSLGKHILEKEMKLQMSIRKEEFHEQLMESKSKIVEEKKNDSKISGEGESEIEDEPIYTEIPQSIRSPKDIVEEAFEEIKEEEEEDEEESEPEPESNKIECQYCGNEYSKYGIKRHEEYCKNK